AVYVLRRLRCHRSALRGPYSACPAQFRFDPVKSLAVPSAGMGRDDFVWALSLSLSDFLDDAETRLGLRMDYIFWRLGDVCRRQLQLLSRREADAHIEGSLLIQAKGRAG